MQLPKVTTPQSRFLASFLASAIFLILYLTLTSPHFAYAVELDSRIPPDHNHPMMLAEPHNSEESGTLASYETPDFEDTSAEIIARAPALVNALENNTPQNLNIEPGAIQYWEFPQAAINGPHGEIGPGLPQDNDTETEDLEVRDELRKRQTGVPVYITLNTCLQPSSSSRSTSEDKLVPPQLQVYISQSSSNQNPGPNVSDSNQQRVTLVGGYALATLEASDTIYIGIAGPSTPGFTGPWNYEIAASIDAPYHGANDTWPNLFFVDSDNHAALLITNDTTQANSSSKVYQEWMEMNPPYGMFAYNGDDMSIWGLRYSYCGLRNSAQIAANIPTIDNQNVAGMTNRGIGGKPKEQFYINGLNVTSQYWAFLAMTGNSTAQGNGVVGGGGKVWAAVNFTTKTESNCALLYNLTFCSEVAYAVPSNPQKFPPATGIPALAAIYDENAAQYYQVFNYSLQQIPCNTSSSAQYSLARNCIDCANAYKQWLCAVTIPRCEDVGNNASWLQLRNVKQLFPNGSHFTLLETDPRLPFLNQVAYNSSRNPIIDEQIKPGPYSELLPCDDLCYDLVQSCPASLGFGCPNPGKGLEMSYGTRTNIDGQLTCSYLGAAYFLGGAERLGGLKMWSTWMVILSAILWLSL